MHVIDASRVVGVVSTLLDPERKATLRRREPRAPGTAPRPARREARRRRCSPTARRSRTARRSNGAPRTSRRRRSPGPGWSSRRSPSCARFIDWTFFFTAWELKGRYPADPRPPRSTARRRASSSTNAQRAAGRDRSRRLDPGARRLRVLARRTPRATTSCWTTGWSFPMLRQQVDQGADDDRPNRSLADFIAPAESGLARPPRRVRGHGGPRRRRPRQDASRPTTTTTARSW